MKSKKLIIVCAFLVGVSGFSLARPGKSGNIVHPGKHEMYFGDTTRVGRPFSKDPHVLFFQGRYLMYYSIPPRENASGMQGWGIGIAESKNLREWKRIGEIEPEETYEARGFCAPGGLVRNDTIHLFYQSYGNGNCDAICHAGSVDGINFTRDSSNPIFAPSGDWNCGRAIDAEVVFCNDKYYLYYATRTPDFSTQIIGVATAPAGASFARNCWTEAADKPVLVPEYPWEGKCVEAPSVVQFGEWMYMFYAGAYNNNPQQIGVAKSKDGIHWEKMSNKPFLSNGDRDTWNYCESGHPHIFRAPGGKTFLFFQGNDDYGKSWLLSNKRVWWHEGIPSLRK